MLQPIFEMLETYSPPEKLWKLTRIRQLEWTSLLLFLLSVGPCAFSSLPGHTSHVESLLLQGNISILKFFALVLKLFIYFFCPGTGNFGWRHQHTSKPLYIKTFAHQNSSLKRPMTKGPICTRRRNRIPPPLPSPRQGGQQREIESSKKATVLQAFSWPNRK